MKKLFFALVFLAVFVFGLTFAARNPQVVGIEYYFGIDVELPLTLLLLGSLVCGVVIGFVASLASGYRRRRRRQRAERAATGAAPGTSVVPRSS